jgi:hypothetical protein
MPNPLIQVDAAAIQRMARDPQFYRDNLLIEVSGEVVRYRDIKAPWQERDFQQMDPAWLRCIGGSTQGNVKMRSMLERPRGASKTFDMAAMVLWALLFATWAVRFLFASGKRDQAKLPLIAMQKLCRLNRWMDPVIDLQANVARNVRTGAQVEAISSDSNTNYGHLADGICCDEWANWPDTPSAQDLWHVLSSTLLKKKNCIAQVISNAGSMTSWQWPIREQIRRSDDWYFHALETKPDWFTEQQLNEQRILLPDHLYKKDIENVWVAGNAEGIRPQDVDSVTVLPGPQGPRRGCRYFGGLDLALRRDHAAFGLWSVSPDSPVVDLVKLVAWDPRDYETGEIDLHEIEYVIEQAYSLYRFVGIKFDAWQAVFLAQRLESKGIPMSEIRMTAEDLNIIARTALDAFSNRRIRLFSNADLRRDILRLRFEETLRGYKLTATRDSFGHADRAVAIFYALPSALNEANRYDVGETRDEYIYA